VATNNVDRGYGVRADKALTGQIVSHGRSAGRKAMAIRSVDSGLRERGGLVCQTAQRVIEALKTECHFRVIRLAKGSIYERLGRVA
jgi:hypothetical protein